MRARRSEPDGRLDTNAYYHPSATGARGREDVVIAPTSAESAVERDDRVNGWALQLNRLPADRPLPS